MPTQLLPELFIQVEKQGQKPRNAFVTNLPWNVEKAGETCLFIMSAIGLYPIDQLGDCSIFISINASKTLPTNAFP